MSTGGYTQRLTIEMARDCMECTVDRIIGKYSPTHVSPSGDITLPGGHEQFPVWEHFSMQAMSFGEQLIFFSVDRIVIYT